MRRTSNSPPTAGMSFPESIGNHTTHREAREGHEKKTCSAKARRRKETPKYLLYLEVGLRSLPGVRDFGKICFQSLASLLCGCFLTLQRLHDCDIAKSISHKG